MSEVLLKERDGEPKKRNDDPELYQSGHLLPESFFEHRFDPEDDIKLQPLLNLIAEKTKTIMRCKPDPVELKPVISINNMNKCFIHWYTEEKLPQIDSYTISGNDVVIVSHKIDSHFSTNVLLKARDMILKESSSQKADSDVCLGRAIGRTKSVMLWIE
jgi:hypothetical protein